MARKRNIKDGSSPLILIMVCLFLFGWADFCLYCKLPQSKYSLHQIKDSSHHQGILSRKEILRACFNDSLILSNSAEADYSSANSDKGGYITMNGRIANKDKDGHMTTSRRIANKDKDGHMNTSRCIANKDKDGHMTTSRCSANKARKNYKIPRQRGLHVEYVASEDRGNYTCHRIKYMLTKTEATYSYLLIPNLSQSSPSTSSSTHSRSTSLSLSNLESFPHGKLPAILLLHDHGARFDIGKEKLVRPMNAPDYIVSSSKEWVDKNFDGAYLADSLASKGYVVLVNDALYWGERSNPKAQLWSQLMFSENDVSTICSSINPNIDDETVKSQSQEKLNHSSNKSENTALGKEDVKEKIKKLKNEVYEGQKAVYDSLQPLNFAGKILFDDLVAVEVLRSLKFVDKNRIGCMGFSMGAHRAWLLTAATPKIKAGVAVCWMTMLKDCRTDNASDFSMRLPKFRERYDFPDIAYALSPRPFLFISGKNDKLFPEAATARAFEIMHEIYSSDISTKTRNQDSIRGNATRYNSMLETQLLDMGHHCGREVQNLVYQFFSKL